MNARNPLLKEVLEAKAAGGNAADAAAGALVYARVSTDQQEEQGLSIPAQLKAIEAYAKERSITILGNYVESGSGFQDEGKRAQFLAMLERAKSDRQVSKILVHEFSRFSRDPWRTPQIIGELQSCGVRVLSVTEPAHDVDTVMGMWMQKVTEAKNASYSMEVAFHTRKGMRQNAGMRDPGSGWCYKNGGKPGWGYRTVRIERTDVRGRPRFKAIWALDETEHAGKPVWQWTKDVLLRALEGASLDSLRDMLNEAGVPAPRGGHWGTSTLRALLERHMILQYAGYGTWNVRKKRRQKWNRPEDWEIVEKAHPALITPEEAQAILAVRKRMRAANAPLRSSRAASHESPFLLSGGPFKCRRCGKNMTGYRVRPWNYEYYVCGSLPYRRGMGCGQATYVPKVGLEAFVVEGVHDIVQACTDARGVVAEANAALRARWESSDTSAKARSELQEAEKKIARLREALEQGSSDVRWLNERLGALLRRQQEIAAACTQTADSTPPAIAPDAARAFLKALDEMMAKGSNEERRQMMRAFLGGMWFDPEAGDVEVRYRIPGFLLKRGEAGTGIAALCSIVVFRRLYAFMQGRGRQPQALRVL